jgi:2,5-diketo-D-gluconate reductase A
MTSSGGALGSERSSAWASVGADRAVLRWHIQRGEIVFPESVTPARMGENVELFDFELGSEAMNSISALDRGEEGRTGQHPDKFDHVPN